VTCLFEQPAALRSRVPLQVTYFVREIASQQQARTAGSLLEPSAHAPVPAP